MESFASNPVVGSACLAPGLSEERPTNVGTHPLSLMGMRAMRDKAYVVVFTQCLQ